ncbi:hypothetical protein FQN49_000332, partial [Arthroderma sp. PD_2]
LRPQRRNLHLHRHLERHPPARSNSSLHSTTLAGRGRATLCSRKGTGSASSRRQIVPMTGGRENYAVSGEVSPQTTAR